MIRTPVSDDDAPTPQPESTIPVIQDWNGNPTILLNPGSKWPFSMGLKKARMVLTNMNFIQRFVDSQGQAVE